MTESTPTLSQLSDRLEKLERQNRRLRQLLFAVASVSMIGWLMAAQKPKSQPAAVEKLALHDATGTTRALLEVGTDGPILRFLDTKGKEQASLGTAPDAFLLQFFGGGTHVRSGLALQGDGVALVYYDRAGKLQSGRNALLLGPGVFPAD